MRKNVISAVAAMTLLASGAFAFESLKTGVIVTKSTEGITGDWIPKGPIAANVNIVQPAVNYTVSSYTWGATNVAAPAGVVAPVMPATGPVVPLPSNLVKSTDGRGDALIYPAFSQKAGYETEMVVRNTYADRAVVAKVVLYSADATRELIDFNIYLSQNDVFRFTIKDGLVKTKDGSIMASVNWPQDKTANTKTDTMTANPSGTEFILNPSDSNGNRILVEDAQGYVSIYAMAQAQKNCVTGGVPAAKVADIGAVAGNGLCTPAAAANLTNKILGYHGKHAELAKDYRHALDNLRGGWRNAFVAGNMLNGMIVNTPVPAPNVQEYTPAYSALDDFKFTNPVSDLLTGTAKITRVTEGQETQMVLPATALLNFTNDTVGAEQLMLWTEGEYAAIQDRRIVGPGIYSAADVESDAYSAFYVASGYYTFEADTANVLLFTQPYKRILVQLNADGYTANNPFLQRDTTWNYNGFQTTLALFDEEENQYVSATGTTIITSPFSSFGSTKLLKDEVAFLTDKDLQLQEGAVKTMFQNKNGFANVTFGDRGLSAIVTQMVGASVNGKAQMNWIYTPTFQ